MNRVFVDLDGVVVNFDGYMVEHNLTPREIKDLKGAYLQMHPLPRALEGVRQLIAMGFEVWIATKPPTVMRYLPELSKRIILTHDKGLLGDSGDVLIDDRPHRANCEKFHGCLIPFVDGVTWEQVISFLGEREYFEEYGCYADFKPEEFS
jgi:hypothetical protein